MANYESYPTPPPTSSPKHHHDTFAAHDPNYQETPASRPQDDMPSRMPGGFEAQNHGSAQEYYKPAQNGHSYSTPSSPIRYGYGHNVAGVMNDSRKEKGRMSNQERIENTSSASYDYLPRRKSSPIIHNSNNMSSKSNGSNNPYFNGTPDPSFTPLNGKPSRANSYNNNSPRPTSRPSSPQIQRKRTPPRPIYFSPINPIPSPYNTSRPSPRPGFLKRMFEKFTSFLQRLIRWARRNPIKAGFITFLPVLAGVGLVKVGKALGLGGLISNSGLAKLVALLGGGIMEGMGGGKSPSRLAREKEEAEKEGREGPKGFETRGMDQVGRSQGFKGEFKAEVAKEEEKWGYGLDHFVGFGGTKRGPLDGIMKIALMATNHYCKLTPSAIPRAAAILLDLYFLEKAEKKL